MWEQFVVKVASSGVGRFFSLFAKRIEKRSLEEDQRRAREHRQELATAKRVEAERLEVRTFCDAAIRALYAAVNEEKRLKWNIYDSIDDSVFTWEENGTRYTDPALYVKAIEIKEARVERAYQKALKPARTALTDLSPYMKGNIVLSSSPSSYELEKAIEAVKQCREQYN
ncbi:hypothetical protein GCM10027160_04040 [Streptomyces calidiresistens]|uniref:Uncharacterized protein n=1 Tax=Streptomyces calidiresistens TaxID=1485586 RepID=A0A7W3T2C0_9ACTN|nr:hypothetical protein [Streptomyces calidiresistens]MBB0229576.1 hypothetical protein [Streptomyces calidiresistens]